MSAIPVRSHFVDEIGFKDGTPGSGHWYVAETSPRAEAFAELNLKRQGFASFCPRFSKVRRHARKSERVLVPVFPGYLFVRFDMLRDQWRSINGTLGIRSLVGFAAGKPQVVPHAVMQSLFARCDGAVMSCILPTLEPGRDVRLAGGPFAGKLATIDRLVEKDRVQVLLDMLGGRFPVRLSSRDLAPV